MNQSKYSVNIFFFFLAALSTLSASCNMQNASGLSQSAVDTSLYYHLDVDYDSIPDELSLNFHGTSISSPFNWSFVIKSAEKKIFEVIRDDKNLDSFFSDTLYTGEACSSYIDCKTKFYYKTLPQLIFKRKIVPEKIDIPGFQSAVIPFLTDSLKLDPDLKIKVLNEFKDRIESGKMIIIPVILSPVINDHSVTYSTTLKRMVPISWD